MSAHAVDSQMGATKDRKVASLFGLEGDSWMKHANPASVWTRFSVLSILALAVWSRDWIGAWSLIPDRPGDRLDVRQPVALRAAEVHAQLGFQGGPR